MKGLLKATAIINFVDVGISLLVAMILSPLLWWFGNGIEVVLATTVILLSFNFITGLTYLNYAKMDVDDLYQRKNTILILGIITLFTNFISGILLLIARDKIVFEFQKNGKKTKKVTIDPEIKKLDILLKVGVAFVSLAGLIFATSNWSITSSTTKIITLLIMGILFIGLSIFSRKKLKLEQSDLMYWTLGIVFILLTGIASGWFKAFGDWFSFFGGGQQLILSTLSFIATILSYITYKRYNEKIYLGVSAIGIIATFGFILAYANVSFVNVISILVLLLMLANVIFKNQKNSIIERFNSVYLFTLSILLTIYYLINDVATIASATLASTLLITNLMCLYKKTKKYTFLVPITSLILIGSTVMAIDLNNAGALIAALFYTAFYIVLIISGYLYQNKKTELVFTIILNILLFITYLVGFGIDPLKNIFIGFLLLIPSIINIAYLDNKSKIEYYLIPIKLILFTSALVYLLNSFMNIDLLFGICISYFTMLFGYFVTEDKKLKLEYFILFGLLLLFAITNVDYNSDAIPTFVVLLSSFFPVIIINNSKEKIYKDFSLAAFIAMLIAIYHTIISSNLLGSFYDLASLLVIAIYLLIMIKYKDKKKYFMAASIALVPPIYNLIGSCDYPIDTILTSMLGFYIVYLFVDNLVKKTSTRNIIYIITISILLISLVFEANLIIGLFVGIVTLGLMLLGIIDNKYNNFFITGFVFLVLNLLIQLNDLWTKIPLWLYLLIAGLLIIGFVMYKEMIKKRLK